MVVVVECDTCGRHFRVRVARQWWRSSRAVCCGRSAALWLDSAGRVTHDGAHGRPAVPSSSPAPIEE